LYVTGAVERPGVVQVQPGARVQDAIRAAGGSAADADLDRVNLAAPLYDGQHLRVPAEGEEFSPDTLPGGGGMVPRLINVNSAAVEELTSLPGVGEATAAAIVAYRQQHGLFTRIEEIMNVTGIGPGKFEGFREMITVGP
jgi:competence protein ComEA